MLFIKKTDQKENKEIIFLCEAPHPTPIELRRRSVYISFHLFSVLLDPK